MFDIVKYFNSFEKYQHICDEISKHNNSSILNTASNIQKLLILNLFKKYNKTIVVVYPNIYEATIAYEDYLELGEAEKISFFPVEDLVASELIASSNTYRLDRIKTLFKVIDNVPQIIVTTPEGLTRNIINKQRLKDSVMHLQIGNIYKRDDLIKGLVTRGYQKVSIVDVPGTFSVRGSVIDIYAINNETPIRIDFFDDEIIGIEIILNYLSRLKDMKEEERFEEIGREKIVESIDHFVSDSDEDPDSDEDLEEIDEDFEDEEIGGEF